MKHLKPATLSLLALIAAFQLTGVAPVAALPPQPAALTSGAGAERNTPDQAGDLREGELIVVNAELVAAVDQLGNTLVLDCSH